LTPSPRHRSLDIIVPVFKNADLTRRCIDSLANNLQEIVEVDPRLVLINDSPDDTPVNDLLAQYQSAQARAVILRNDTNLGFIRTVNRGLNAALRDGRDALLVNSDTQTFPGTLRVLLMAARSDPQIGFASPRSNNASICSLPQAADDRNLTPEAAFARWSVIAKTMPLYHFAPTAVGFYLFIAHSVLANHEHLDEDFGAGYEEENDLIMRAGKVGTRAVIVNHAFAYHQGAASFEITEIDIPGHKHRNLGRISQLHPEFLPLVRRYEESAHFQAEQLIGGLHADADRRTKIVFDLTGMGQHYNGTNEQAVAVLGAVARRSGRQLRLTGLASLESFLFHGLDRIEGLHREDPGAPGLHAIAIRLAQPFDMHDICRLEALAPINVFAMLDTIAEDCGPLAAESDVGRLWEHAAEHANGLVFTSAFAESTFLNRHPVARANAFWTQLLPTRLANYRKLARDSKCSHILVLGNHFAHKGSTAAAAAIAAAFPTTKVVAFGDAPRAEGNLTIYRPGLLEAAEVEQLCSDAAVIVLPSYVEGFGFGIMHAMAAGRPIVARRIAPTEEILARLDDVKGVHLFDFDPDLVQACRQALNCASSSAVDDRGTDWEDWADGLIRFSVSLLERPDIFPKLVRRIEASTRLWRVKHGERSSADAIQEPKARLGIPPPLSNAKPVDLGTLMAMDGREFVEHAYATVLRRAVDEGGMQTYLAELSSGAEKVDIILALAGSAEGRLRNVQLSGIEQLKKAAGRRVLIRQVRRLFNTQG
jgi:GT2 family glycosyltransferase